MRSQVKLGGMLTSKLKRKPAIPAKKGINLFTKEPCDFKANEVLVRINKQSPDIAEGVHVGKDEMDVGAGDQGNMLGFEGQALEGSPQAGRYSYASVRWPLPLSYG